VSTSPWLDSLTAERERIGRASTAGRVADVLRDRVTEGHLVPGTRLSEEEIGEALGVSRNTLREAFRLLSHERLLEHVFNRGVFVRSLSRDDVRDVYRVRRLVECAAVRYAGGLDTEGDLAPEALAGPLAALQAAVAEGERAHDARDWPGIGTANMRFHQALASLAGSPRVDETMRHLLAELRLVFHVMADPRAFHEPYLAGNREICGLLEAGRYDEAEAALSAYFDRAEGQLLAAMAG
jgi:DNA-binding GntR family transcriptional regulator